MGVARAWSKLEINKIINIQLYNLDFYLQNVRSKQSPSLLVWSKNALQNGLFWSFCYHAYIVLYIYIYGSIQSFVYIQGLARFSRICGFLRKVSDFSTIFFGWVLHRGGQGPGKGPNISYKTARVVGLTPSLKSQGRGLRNPRKSAV